MIYTPNPGSESRWTRPTDACPHPERWTSDDDDSTEYEVSFLVAAFIRALQPDYVIETGTAWGQTTQRIGHALAEAGQGHLISLEPDPDRVQYSKTRCTGLPVTIVQCESLEFTPSQQIDFAWFDSLIHLRAPEFRYFREWMHNRTVVGFHDTGSQHDMKRHVDQLAHEGLIQPIYLPTPRGVCFARVL